MDIEISNNQDRGSVEETSERKSYMMIEVGGGVDSFSTGVLSQVKAV